MLESRVILANLVIDVVDIECPPHVMHLTPVIPGMSHQAGRVDPFVKRGYRIIEYMR